MFDDDTLDEEELDDMIGTEEVLKDAGILEDEWNPDDSFDVTGNPYDIKIEWEYE